MQTVFIKNLFIYIVKTVFLLYNKADFKTEIDKMSGKLAKDFTKGNIAKQLLWFTLPFMASNALQVLYSTIDMIIVGQYVGTDGLSAVAQSS